MGFLGYLVRRLALALPTLFGVSLICFFLTYMLPGNPAMVKAGPFATPEHLAEMERAMGLDRSSTSSTAVTPQRAAARGSR